MPEAEALQTLSNRLKPSAREQTIPTAKLQVYQDYEKARCKTRKGRDAGSPFCAGHPGGLSDAQKGGSLS
jgi:hypothetical protein